MRLNLKSNYVIFIVIILVLISGCQTISKIDTTKLFKMGNSNLNCGEKPGQIMCGFCDKEKTTVDNPQAGLCRYCPSGSTCKGDPCGKVTCLKIESGTGLNQANGYRFKITENKDTFPELVAKAKTETFDVDSLKFPDGTVGEPYSAAFDAEGGTGKYTYSIFDSMTGSPPAGITLSPNGELKGTPTKAGLTTFNVCAEDEEGNGDCKTVSININPKKEPLPESNTGIVSKGLYEGIINEKRYDLLNDGDCRIENGMKVRICAARTGQKVEATIRVYDLEELSRTVSITEHGTCRIEISNRETDTDTFTGQLDSDGNLHIDLIFFSDLSFGTKFETNRPDLESHMTASLNENAMNLYYYHKYTQLLPSGQVVQLHQTEGRFTATKVADDC